MFSIGFSANKLRVNLKLVINRLKLLEKKKSKAVSYLYFVLYLHLRRLNFWFMVVHLLNEWSVN